MSRLKEWIRFKLLWQFAGFVAAWLLLTQFILFYFGIKASYTVYTANLIGVIGIFYFVAARHVRKLVTAKREELDREDPFCTEVPEGMPTESQEDYSEEIPKNEVGELYKRMGKLFIEVNSLKAESASSAEPLRLAPASVEENELISDMAASIVHDLKNPLSSLLIYLDLLEKALEDESGEGPSAKEALDKISFSVQWINKLIERMSDQGESRLEMDEALDIRKVIKNAVSLVKERIEKRGAKIEIRLPENLPTIWGNQESLERVFLNLLNNALEATEPNQGRIQIAASFGTEEVRMELADNGCGVSEEDAPNLFQPFYTTKTRTKGRGIGLAISRQIMLRHHGHLDAFSKQSNGTVFTMRLRRNAPVIESREPRESRESSEAA